MIRLIKGVVELVDNSFVLVDVNGVGYKIVSNTSLLAKLRIGESVKLFTYTYVKEDLLELYGFPTHTDLKLFEAIITVSGIGPKTALGIFSLGSGNEISQAIFEGNVTFFTGVPRLGKKNAQKLIIELRGKLGSLEELDISQDSSDSQELLTALQSFGFTTAESYKAIKTIKQNDLSLNEKMKIALKSLGK